MSRFPVLQSKAAFVFVSFSFGFVLMFEYPGDQLGANTHMCCTVLFMQIHLVKMLLLWEDQLLMSLDSVT